MLDKYEGAIRHTGLDESLVQGELFSRMKNPTSFTLLACKQTQKLTDDCLSVKQMEAK